MSIDLLQRQLVYQRVFDKLAVECQRAGWLRPIATDMNIIHLLPLRRLRGSGLSVGRFLTSCGFVRAWNWRYPLVRYKGITYHHPEWSKDE